MRRPCGLLTQAPVIEQADELALSFPPPQYAPSRYLPAMVTPTPWWALDA